MGSVSGEPRLRLVRSACHSVRTLQGVTEWESLDASQLSSCYQEMP